MIAFTYFIVRGVRNDHACSLVVAAMATGVTTIWTLDRSDFETYRLLNRKRFRLVKMA